MAQQSERTPATVRSSTDPRRRNDPGYQAFWALRIGYAVLPMLTGGDKFAHLMTDWDRYFAPPLERLLPGSMTVHTAMYLVGIIEIVAGLAVLLEPRVGGLLVAGWLVAIMVDLVLLSHNGDIAMRDIGLFLGALTLARLAWAYPESGILGARAARRSSIRS